jgi:DNA-binding MarR family transcriptional regulator
MTAAREYRPSDDHATRFLHYLAEILRGIAPMPPEVMVRLGHALKDVMTDLHCQPAAEPPNFYRMAVLLSQEPRPTIGELSDSLSLPVSTVSRIVSQLEERGYAQRLPDPTDGRVVRVAMTDSARELYEMATSRAARNAESVLACLTLEERTILLTLMAKLAANLDRETR